MTVTSEGGGWVLFPSEHLPREWRGRSRNVVLVPLLPEEVASVLEGRPATPALDERDERIARMLAAGASLARIALAVELSPRGVQHRITKLRARFDARSTAELIAYLARHGMGMDQTRNGPPEERSGSGTKEPFDDGVR